MSRRSRRRTRSPRSLPPQPGQPALDAAAGGTSPAPRSSAPDRPQRILDRDTPYIAAELRRIAYVTVACTGLLVALAVIDRIG